MTNLETICKQINTFLDASHNNSNLSHDWNVSDIFCKLISQIAQHPNMGSFYRQSRRLFAGSVALLPKMTPPFCGLWRGTNVWKCSVRQGGANRRRRFYAPIETSSPSDLVARLTHTARSHARKRLLCHRSAIYGRTPCWRPVAGDRVRCVSSSSSLLSRWTVVPAPLSRSPPPPPAVPPGRLPLWRVFLLKVAGARGCPVAPRRAASASSHAVPTAGFLFPRRWRDDSLCCSTGFAPAAALRRQRRVAVVVLLHHRRRSEAVAVPVGIRL